MSEIKALPRLSRYKWKRLGTASLANALRLHRDAIFLFNAGSYPTAYQLSVISLEEFAKAKMVEHYFYTCITNEGFPSAKDEQEWLRLLYVHGEKQYAFVARDQFEYAPSLVKAIKNGSLEHRKQKAVYVGLERVAKSIAVKGRISTPNLVKDKEAKRMISWLNAEFLFAYNCLCFYESYFGIEGMDEVLLSEEAQIIFDWPYKSRTRLFKSRVPKAPRR